jgi:hypothetical protein
MRPILILTVVLFASGFAAAEERITTTYDVTDLLRRDGKSGLASVDEIVKFIVGNVRPTAWLAAPDGGNRITEVNGRDLVIKAMKADHAEIKELLEAVRSLHDVAVDLKASVVFVEAKTFAKEIKPHLGKPVVVENDEVDSARETALLAAVKKHGRREQSNSLRLANGGAGLFASLRKASAYATGEVADGQPVWGAEFTGFSYRGTATVTGDRRFVKVALTEAVSARGAPARKDAAAPPIQEAKATRELTIPDGGMAVLVVPPNPAVAEGRVLLLLLEPRIRIEAEEKERGGEKKDG